MIIADTKLGCAAIVMIAPLLAPMPQAAAQQNTGQMQNGVIVLRGSGPPEPAQPSTPPVAGGAPVSEALKPPAGYCDVLARSTRPPDRTLHDTVCGSDAKK